MKKYFLSLILFLSAAISYAQWQPDVRLTNDSALSYTSLNNAWCIASSGNYVHVVWFDNRDGNDEIYYKRSTDEGVSWGADTRLTNNTYVSSYPSIAVSGSDVRVVWQDNRSDGRYELYYIWSIDGGITWGVSSRLTNNSGESRYPSIAVSGTTTHLIWYSWREYRTEIYYKRSLDGTNWGTDVRLTDNDSNFSQIPSIAVYNLGVHVVWSDERDSNNEIYYKRSIDGGTTWGQDNRLTNNTAVSQKHCVAVSPQGEVHVVWVDNRDGNYEIYYKGSADGGVNWGEDTRLTNNGSSSLHPSVAVSDSLQGRVHVVWMDREGSNEIFYKGSTDGGTNWEGETRLTNSADESGYPSVSGFPRGGAQVVWQDYRDGNYEIYYKRNPTGITGIDNIILEVPNRIELEQNYPNPFNPITTIRYAIPNVGTGLALSAVTLKVYDILGNEVATLVDEYKPAGSYEVEFNVKTLRATLLPSGVYFYQLRAGAFVQTKKMLMLK